MFPKLAKAFTVLDSAYPIRLTSPIDSTADVLVEEYAELSFEGIPEFSHWISRVAVGDKIVGFVDYDDCVEHPDARLAELLLPISLSDIIQANVPLIDAPSLLTDRIQVIIIQQGNHPTHFLNFLVLLDSLPLKLLLLALVMELEHLLRRHFRDVPEVTLRSLLSSRRVDNIAATFEHEKERQSKQPSPFRGMGHLRMIELASFGDLLAMAQSDSLVGQYLLPGDSSNPTQMLPMLRNRLAHSLRIWDIFNNPTDLSSVLTHLQLMNNTSDW